MNIVQTINIPSPPSSDLGFYERTNPECVLTSTEDAREAEVFLGSYDGLTWNSANAPEELYQAESWGTKTLPGAGPFYFANHEDGEPTIGHIDNSEPPL